MKRLASVILLILIVLVAQAQTAREEIKANRQLSANNYYAYPTPTVKQQAAPKGYEPFYISTYARHGSRYLIDPNDYLFPKQVLLKADSLNKLTTKGKSTLNIVLKMAEMANERLGELTPLGARQHRGIAKRMFTNFPQIFADSTEVDARSTVVIRCILSMTAECLQLQAMNPNLRIKNDASYHDMFYMNHKDKNLEKLVKSAEVKKIMNDFEANHVHPSRLMKVLFTDEEYVRNNVDAARLMRRLFDIAANMQSHDTDMELYSLFNDDECYDLWNCNNVNWFLNSGCSPLTQCLMPYREAELLRNILDTADDALKDGKRRATLRFGHESCVLPFVALLELNHYGQSYPDIEKLSEQWRAYEVFPMACNVQFVFFHKKGNADILVKVLLNEREMKLPVESDLTPYYHWKDVSSYYRNKLSKYN
ncbi:histidine-type phosphatase [Bacteroides faecalis]|uniref:Multiple inositol polyphosphate phosphatase 1 n=1 Tax=Bacteroides faecalis TaxID=2447885 RepID=A0A401LR53_9BACE|nr:histidine-type phosphatase [Bacteroides faecalis]GCB33941.1 multiple inositol polyphosphate histidine phosphatase 1 [Bacteroides faecalis]